MAASETSQVLPEFLPYAPPAIVRPIWVPWPIAVLLAPLFWLMPKRFGPHLAVASWTAAIFSHLAWGVYGAASILLAIAAPQYTLASWLLGRTPEQLGQSLAPVPTFGEILRGPLAFLVSLPAQMPLMMGGMAAVAPPGIVSASPLELIPVELGLCATAALLMPFIAAGEPSRRLLGRSIKLVLWASTSLFVLAIAIQAMVIHNKNMLYDWPGILLVALYCAWMVGLVIRGGARYAGPADGPAWQPREPLCTGCGYGLTGLLRDGSCPECNRSVAESLPAYRQPSPFAAASSLPARIQAFPRTCWHVLWDKRFYERLATHDGLPPARRFAIWTCAVSAILLLAGHALASDLSYRLAGQDPGNYWDDLPLLCMAVICLGLGLIGLVGLAALAVSRFGWRPIYNRAIVAFYGSAWLLPLGISLIVSFYLIVWLVDHPFFQLQYVDIPQIGQVDLHVATALSVLVIPGYVLWRALAHLRRGVRGVRYANS